MSNICGWTGNGGRGKLGKPAHLEELVVTMKSTAAGESVFRVAFEWDESQGIPGAVVVTYSNRSEFFLKTLTLDGVPGKVTVVFVANSWIYPADNYQYERVFFANDVSPLLVLLLVNGHLSYSRSLVVLLHFHFQMDIANATALLQCCSKTIVNSC